MYPESNYTPIPAPAKSQQLVLRRRLIFAAVLVIVAAIVTIICVLALRPRFDQYGLTNTGLQAKQNFGYINDKDLYGYNGLAFYKTNLSDSKITVLSSGHKLPIPSAIYWADSKGALMNFSGSFAMTDVEVAPTDDQASDEKNNTWYLDFSTGKLSFVGAYTIVSDLAYYSKAENGFYYIPNVGDNLLYFYDMTSGKNTVVSEDLKVTSIKTIQACPDAKTVCLVGRDESDTSKQKLYSIKRGEGKKVLLESTGRIFPTNNPEMYLAVGEGSDPQKIPDTAGQPEDMGEADFTEGPAGMYNIKTKAEYKLDFNIGISDPTTHFINDKQFYIIEGLPSDGSDTPRYRSGELTDHGSKSDTYTMGFNDGGVFNSHVIGIRSHGSGDLSVGTIMDGNQVVLSGQKDKVTIAQKDQSGAEKIVKDCVAAHAKSSQYFSETKMFRIISVADENFAQNIDLFSKCVVHSDATILHGYNFQFAGSDPVNGRLSTD